MTFLAALYAYAHKDPITFFGALVTFIFIVWFFIENYITIPLMVKRSNAKSKLDASPTVR